MGNLQKILLTISFSVLTKKVSNVLLIPQVSLCPGDPDTSSVVGRFRVNRLTREFDGMSRQKASGSVIGTS